jgi:hypothetical protein
MTKLLLFASLGFFEGMGRVLDLGSTMLAYNDSSTPEEADARAIMSDWMEVGQDLDTAVRNYGEKFSQEKE